MLSSFIVPAGTYSGARLELSGPGAVVAQRGHAATRLGDPGEVELGRNDCRLLAPVGQDLAPGIDDQRMTPALAAALMRAALRRGQHEAAGLDRAGADQDLPMRAAGGDGEGRGD